MRFLFLGIIVLAVSACSSTSNRSSSSHTATPAKAEAPEVVSPEQYVLFLNELETGLADGQPRQLNDAEMDQVGRMTTRLRGMLAGIDSIEELDTDEQEKVFNLNQELWATVVGNDEEQVICRREHVVGTHFKRTICRTVAEIRGDRGHTDLALRGMYRPSPKNGEAL